MILSSYMDNPVATQIRAFLQDRQMNQSEFAKLCGIGKGGVSLLLSATDPNNMKAGNLRKAAKAMGLSMEQLLIGSPNANEGRDSIAQFRNDIVALQIVARSLTRAVQRNMQVVGQHLADEIDEETAPREGAKPFEKDSGLLLEVLSILGRAAPIEAAADLPVRPSGSGRRSMR
jgi:transcriptional regulator with XRE-family HTH domain